MKSVYPVYKGDMGKVGESDAFSEEQLQIFVRQMLCGQVFTGEYRERSYVPRLGSYRDVVELCAREKDIRATLEDVQARLQKYYGTSDICTGISNEGSTNKLRLHVTLKDVAFGRYWFLIKNVKFTGVEVVYRLKCLRLYAEEPEGTTEGEAMPEQSVKWGELLEDWKHALSRGAGVALSVENVRQVAVFLVVLLAGLLTGTVHFVRHLGDFSIRLVRELSGLIRALTPVALGIIDFFSKCVGGLYILVAMMFRGQRPPPQFPMYPGAPGPGTMRSIQYRRDRGSRL